MDLIGPLPTTKLGNNSIVTWVDQTTKTIVATAAKALTSKETLARLTFQEILCRFGLPLNLTMDNDVRFNNGLWKSLWKMCWSKLKFTFSYLPQADPAERANRQVMEALRAAVATVAQYDEWAHITFGLNTHISTTTKLSLFEFAHGFPARVPLTFSQPSPQAPPGETLHIGAAAIANRMKMRHWAAANHLAAARARLGHVLAKRSRPATLNVCDLVWMDSRHTPNDIPFKLTARWFRPFTVLQVKGAQATLDLPSTFGKAHRQVNIARLKFFEPRESKLGDENLRPQPLWGHGGVPHYEISRICNARCHKGVDELWVEWKGYDQSQNGWVAWSSLLYNVPHLVHAFEANPSVFITRKIAPKRASTAVRDVTLPPPPPALPNDPLHPRLIKSAVVLKNKHLVGIVGTCRATLRSGVKDVVNNT